MLTPCFCRVFFELLTRLRVLERYLSSTTRNSMFTAHRITLATLSLLFLSLSANAEVPEKTNAEVPEKISQAAEKLGLTVDYASPSPMNDFYQVMTNKGLIYLSVDGKNMLHGNLYALGDNPRNLTQEAMADARVAGVDKHQATMLRFPAEDEKFAVTVFTDTSCGYCRQLHKQVDEYNKLGISINYMAFPRAGMNSSSATDLARIWCAIDPKQAMTQAQSGSAVPGKGDPCSQNVSDQFEFGRKVGIDRTPSLILQNGELLLGYKPPKQLLAYLQKRPG